jgi:putative exosortase-associated protein (TIGR04073 family)
VGVAVEDLCVLVHGSILEFDVIGAEAKYRGPQGEEGKPDDAYESTLEHAYISSTAACESTANPTEFRVDSFWARVRLATGRDTRRKDPENMSKGKAGGWLLVAAVVFGCSAMSCSADDAARKLGRGLANTLFGIAEIPIQIQATMEKEGSGAGATVGVLRGFGRFFMREGVGIYEVLTFPIPFPKYYEPIMEPEFLLNEMNNYN